MFMRLGMEDWRGLFGLKGGEGLKVLFNWCWALGLKVWGVVL